MADPRWQRTWDIFHDALERAPETRAAFVAGACGGDQALVDEVNALLGALDRSAFLETPPQWLGEAIDPDELAAGTGIGAYVVRRLVGRGGMGEVYEAEQRGDITRPVALKLIRSGMASREILARFAMERQALALMNHPNIATAYDVGVTADGRPYFAMEFVDGRPLTQFCEAHGLSVPDRLRLFLRVCDAVGHAHQKGILHRDLKPSNVLAARDGERTIVKVIDFGVAKATGPGLDRTAFVTQAGRFIGTPEYMSPEQAGVAKSDVDTRADIYSLGVLLYELLAGVLPVDPERLKSASFGEIERLLYVDDLPRPSERAAPPVARQLRGDLDSIIGRAMERDRERRYPSVSELAADITRFLANEPIVARPADAIYRARKFVRRHRVAVAAASMLTVVSAAFVVSLILSNARTARALRDAEVERERSNQVSAFLTNLFRVSKPSTAAANATTARELLDQGAAGIKTQLADQPLVQAQLMNTMGEAYTNLGLLDQAETLLVDALDLRRTTLGAHHADVAESLQRLGRLNVSQGKHKEALARHQEALAIVQRAVPPDLAAITLAQNNVGRALWTVGDLDAAAAMLTEALATRTDRLKVEDEVVGNILNNLGGVALARGELDAALGYRRRAADIMLRVFGEDHIEVARARNDLAIVYFQQGDDAAAEDTYRKGLATYIAVLGDDHAEVATLKNNLASVVRRRGNIAEAEALLRSALDIRRRQLGASHPEVAVTSNNLALLLRAKGDPAGAAEMLRDANGIMRTVYGDTHASTLSTLANLGEVLHEAGSPDAERILAEALALRRKTLPASHQNIAVSMSLLGHVRAHRGDATAAEPMLREALAAVEKSLPAASPRLGQVKAYLGGALADLGRCAEAGPLLRTGQALLGKTPTPHDLAYIDRQLVRCSGKSAR